MGVATGSIALHMLARASMKLPAEEKKTIVSREWFGKLMMRLGGQLAGASETDAQGLVCILWALAALEQSDSPLLKGLINRVLLLIQHGRVNTPQLLLVAQALARLKQLGGENARVGLALSNLLQHRIGELNAPSCTIPRCMAEAGDSANGGAEPFLRAILSTRLGEFSLEAGGACRMPRLGRP